VPAHAEVLSHNLLKCEMLRHASVSPCLHAEVRFRHAGVADIGDAERQRTAEKYKKMLAEVGDKITDPIIGELLCVTSNSRGFNNSFSEKLPVLKDLGGSYGAKINYSC
jgi:hypothetical protein